VTTTTTVITVHNRVFDKRYRIEVPAAGLLDALIAHFKPLQDNPHNFNPHTAEAAECYVRVDAEGEILVVIYPTRTIKKAKAYIRDVIQQEREHCSGLPLRAAQLWRPAQ
jgi:hypothetical protein